LILITSCALANIVLDFVLSCRRSWFPHEKY